MSLERMIILLENPEIGYNCEVIKALKVNGQPLILGMVVYLQMFVVLLCGLSMTMLGKMLCPNI